MPARRGPRGVGSTAIDALMQAHYASATIAADRGQRSFGLSLEQFMAKRGSATIVARGRSLKQSQAAMFASIQQRYGVPPGPLIAIWGMESGFGSQRGNQNMLSSIATLAYDCRRPDFFTDQLYAALKLIDRGTLSGSTRGSMHGEIGQTQFMPKKRPRLWHRQSRRRRQCADLDGELPARPWLARRRRLSARGTQLCRDRGVERGRGLSEGDRHHGTADRRPTERGSAEVRVPSPLLDATMPRSCGGAKAERAETGSMLKNGTLCGVVSNRRSRTAPCSRACGRRQAVGPRQHHALRRHLRGRWRTLLGRADHPARTARDMTPYSAPTISWSGSKASANGPIAICKGKADAVPDLAFEVTLMPSQEVSAEPDASLPTPKFDPSKLPKLPKRSESLKAKAR